MERIPGVTTLVKDPVSGDLRARSGNQVMGGGFGVPLLIIQKGGVYTLPETNIISGNRPCLPQKEIHLPKHHF